MNKLITDIKNMKIVIIVLIIYFIIMQLVFGSICPFMAIFKVRCPGCGLTHATIYLFTGRFNAAFNTNPNVLLWITSILLFFIDRYIINLKIKVFPYIFIIVSIINLIWYVLSINNIGI